ncbi:MAG: hypothetical protein AUJ52_04680 [Elusimicrobia bacterium CG1_02_63_36]|nr:MAG: hypothetical protein AUJ52_04680 [Elusimicrobia bacterium CG1_02_63_36]PIP83045.1 MAG: hypothetical protein COR54_11665 [Elusimicrobia bacterium CG22_combo_CG10-13_8_21_14_all_63_91]PJA14179.1 MAG: hypothetical protein COX66_13265 [Elusimicrobia bacterium CG_4_10_14_0_2_um_filter_63_34]PJB24425.1 MAG: hypothetical protein CO113_13965 [Elusimicrobia bacterium CG_4_9_14_3_um_filter_62_55]
MRFPIHFLSVLAVAVIFAAFADAAALTLPEAVDAALARNPGTAAAEAALRAAKAERSVWDLSRLPVLRAKAGFTRGDDPVYVFGSLLRQGDFGPANFAIGALNDPGALNDFSSGIEIGVPVFTGFQLDSRRRLARVSERQAELGVFAGRQGLRESVVDLYLRGLMIEALAHSLAARIASAEVEIGSADKLKARGLVLGSDYEAAQAVLGGLRVRLEEANSGREAIGRTLGVLLARDPASITLSGTLSSPTDDAGFQFTKSAAPIDSRPDVRRAALNAEAAAAVRRAERMTLLPRVEAFGGIETHSRDLSSNPATRMVGVRASLAFGDPTYLSRTAAAKARGEAGADEARRVREAAEIELARARSAYEGAARTLPLAEQMLRRARASIEKFRPLYREGRQSILEVLRAESGLADAEEARLRTFYGLHAGRARVIAASGGMDEEAVAEIGKNLLGELQ